jgi:glyceraldehyde-3-phosphate dehydrogenase (NAD(P))
MKKIRVAVNGYGVIGKRVADAVALQTDMELAGVCDVSNDWRIKIALQKKYKVFSADTSSRSSMMESDIEVSGLLDDLLASCDVVVDCTPKKFGAANIAKYKQAGIKYILHGGEKHNTTQHSFVAEVSYETALNRECTRVVSCNTTSIVRTLHTLKQAELLQYARGTLMRRATDPWESDQGGIMNTIVLEPTIPSHQAPDAQTVIPDLDVVTVAVKVPQTLAHIHYWNVKLTRPTSREEVIDTFRKSSRIAFVKQSEGFHAINSVKELMLTQNRPLGDMYEVVVWEDMITVKGDELFYAYMVDNQAIVIPDTIDAIRAISGSKTSAVDSIIQTNKSFGITQHFY